MRVATSGSFPRVAAGSIARALREAAREGGEVGVALAGGSTPRPVYRRLARLEAPWGRLRVFFGDERCVPPDDPRSNYRMVRETLLTDAPLDPDRLHRMEGERDDRDAAAREYGALLPASLGLLVLGIGSDGHTASLFPGSPALDEEERRVVPVEGPAESPPRLTVTPPVIRAASRTVVLARGAEKAEAVARAVEGEAPVAECPARLARGGEWIVDDAAATRLSPRRRGPREP